MTILTERVALAPVPYFRQADRRPESLAELPASARGVRGFPEDPASDGRWTSWVHDPGFSIPSGLSVFFNINKFLLEERRQGADNVSL